MNRISNILWGLVLVGIGIIFGLNALEITDINIFFDGWWTLFIIVPCFISLFKDQDKTGDIIGLIIGICLLLGCQDLLAFELVWKLMIPVILVVIGLSIIFKDTIHSVVRKQAKKLSKKTDKEFCATFSGQDLDFTNEEFKGCDLSAVFGGIKCNLKEAIINEDIAINTSSVFGGITIYVPSDVNVKITSTSIFGGVSDERKKKTKDGKVTIYIQATNLFGGVEIK